VAKPEGVVHRCAVNQLHETALFSSAHSDGSYGNTSQGVPVPAPSARASPRDGRVMRLANMDSHCFSSTVNRDIAAMCHTLHSSVIARYEPILYPSK
jgi:hypothetical protein